MKIILLLSFFTIFTFANADEKYILGKKIYKETCISCHGVDGKADTNLKLVVRPRDLTKTILNEEQTYLITKDGAHFWGAKADIMPAFKYTYNEKQLKAVSYYISKEFNPNSEEKVKEAYSKSKVIPEQRISKMLKRGKKVYFRNCKYCHGLSGEGDGEATKNPTDSIFPYNLKKTLLTEKQIFLYIKYGGQHWGTYKDDMPSWRIKYDDFTLKSTARFVDELIRGNR